MKALLVFSLMTLSLVSFAQYGRGSRVSEEADRVAREVRYSESRLSPSQEQAVMEHLRAIRGILLNDNNQGGGYNGGGNNGGDYGDQATYTCVARDNDNMAPWVIAIREGITVTRIKSASWGSKAACEETLNTTVPVRGKNLFCMARDNDGMAPFVMASLNGDSVQKFQNLSWNSMAACQGVLRGIRPHRPTAIFCSARDNDGISPFVAIELNVDNFSVLKGTEQFNSMAQCNQFLSQ